MEREVVLLRDGRERELEEWSGARTREVEIALHLALGVQ